MKKIRFVCVLAGVLLGLSSPGRAEDDPVEVMKSFLRRVKLDAYIEKTSDSEIRLVIAGKCEMMDKGIAPDTIMHNAIDQFKEDANSFLVAMAALLATPEMCPKHSEKIKQWIETDLKK